MNNNTIKIYVHLLEEGTPTIRPTEAVSLPNGLYQLLSTPDYDPEDEIWEFLPGSIVKGIDSFNDKGMPLILAVARNDL